MKKTILLAACIFIATFSTQAQKELEKPKDKKVIFGLRTGYEFQANNSNLEYELNIPYLGVFSDIRLREKWSLQLELNLRSEKRERLFNNGSISINEVYLTVPVLLKYKANKTFNFYAGTQILSASLVNDINGLKKWNGIIGVEYNLIEKLFIDARFRHGFEERTIINFRDNRISIGVGYKF